MTAKSFKLKKRDKINITFPLRIPNFSFLKLETFYLVVEIKLEMQSRHMTLSVNGSPKNSPSKVLGKNKP
jgi:hypothetical protein